MKWFNTLTTADHQNTGARTSCVTRDTDATRDTTA